MPGKCHFNPNWCDTKDIKGIKAWLRPVASDKSKAHCKICNKDIDISNSGITSIKKHAIGKTCFLYGRN